MRRVSDQGLGNFASSWELPHVTDRDANKTWYETM